MKLAAQTLSVALAGRTVLHSISFALEPGCMTAVVGPNGAGKSSCLRALAGLLPTTSGDVLLDGRSLAATDSATLGRSIGFLPQSRIVHWPLSVERTVMLGRRPHEPSADNDRTAVAAAMRDLDIAQFRDRAVTELSGGELARVLMARVLAQATPIILADEPTAGLDPAHQLALLDRLAALARAGRTVALALHDLSLAARYCQRVLLLKDGRLVADDTPRATLTPARLRDAFGIEAKVDTIDGIPVVLPLGLC